MARFCVRDGITHVGATPHCHRHLRLLRADILPPVARLNEELARGSVPLTAPWSAGFHSGHRARATVSLCAPEGTADRPKKLPQER